MRHEYEERILFNDGPEILGVAPPGLRLRNDAFNSIQRAYKSIDKYNESISYNDAVKEYSSRVLTFETDRLHAFSGFLSKLAPNDAVAVRTGLPLRHFGESLTWHIDDPGNAETARKVMSAKRAKISHSVTPS